MRNFPYPVLVHLMRAYLNQDWDYEYGNDLEALDDFVDGDSRVPKLLEDFDGALTMPEPELYEVIAGLSGYTFGDSAHDWLEKLRAHLIARAAAGQSD